MNRNFWKRTFSTGVMASACMLSGCCKPTLVWERVYCGNLFARCGLVGRSNAIPDTFPLGSINRAHYHTMETNGEAGDFVLHRYEFKGNTAELTPYGRDHIMEIGARMRSAPFPVLIERSLNNSDPELDALRRQIVARILTDFGNQDADQRTIVSQPYAKGINSFEGESMYYQYLSSQRGNQFGGNNGGNAGGAGGGTF